MYLPYVIENKTNIKVRQRDNYNTKHYCDNSYNNHHNSLVFFPSKYCKFDSRKENGNYICVALYELKSLTPSHFVYFFWAFLFVMTPLQLPTPRPAGT